MMMKMMMMMVMMMKMKVSPASVAQQDEEQAAEDAGEPTVDSDQQGGHGAVALITVAAWTTWRQTQHI